MDGDVVVAKRVYVNNLPYTTTWQDLKDHFQKAGKVVYTTVLGESKGQSKGCGIVEFTAPGEAAKAIERLSGTEMGGRLIWVREDREDKELMDYVTPNKRRRYA
eukprot:NODE_15949_length_1020_cov_5.723404.p2 GENE.NODE_15949_length_1020_cov_5.723404~~NODE_15949_length_1020_cov_5.723404.p2  ORF type:complete len:104 (-),score=35.31 NODE_15949_length_1020_cov_5.723404:278-589(-)